MNTHPMKPAPIDDPRLTAYALGELDGAEHAADRAQIEALLASDAAARESVAEIRAVAAELAEDLAAEAAQVATVAGLTEAQRRAIELALPHPMNGATHGAARASAASGVPAETGAPANASAAHDDLAAARGRPAGGYPRWLRFLPALAAAGFIAVLVWHEESPPAETPAAAAGATLARSNTEHAVLDSREPASGLGLVASESKDDVAGKSEAEMQWYVANGSLAYPLPDHGGAAPAPAAAPSNGSGSRSASASSANGDAGAEDAAHDLETLRSLGYVGTGASAPASAPPAHPGARANPVATELTPEVREQLMQLGYIEAGSGGGGGGNRIDSLATPSPSTPASAGNQTLKALGYLGAADDKEAPPRIVANSAAGGRGRDRDQGYRYFRTAPGGEGYQPIVEAGFQSPLVAPRSTFSVDVDTASYANVRRFLNAGQLPPADAVRLEELINYFRYDYPQPVGEHPFSVSTDVTACPWAPSHRLVRIGLQGRAVPQAERAPSNLVFLVDVSGSMDSPDKLPLVQASLRLLVGKLDPRDRIALVTYAGNAGLVLDSTGCAQKQAILDALDRLQAGGSTAGGAGIALAYQVATQHFIAGGTNRVILATDGDFNVGATSREELQSLIERSAKSGVFLTVLGFGTGNLQDGTAELLADKGNGNYAYIDSLGEAQKVLVQQMGGTLVTIAKDVKLQVEFNPGRVGSYRLLGYENRALATRDFNDDRKDAGEIGAGHSVTALYEIIPVGVSDAPAVDALRYQKDAAPAAAAAPALNDSPELLYVALRYKQPTSDSSTLLGQPVVDGGAADDDGLLSANGLHPRKEDKTPGSAGDAGSAGNAGNAGNAGSAAAQGFRSAQFVADSQFVAAVAEFGMLLRHSGNAGTASWDSVRALAEAGRGADADGYRAEFVRLVDIARSLAAPDSR